MKISDSTHVLIALFLSSTISIVSAGTVQNSVNGYEFIENFNFSGNHAAHIANGSATTVWWDESAWDVRGDTSFISVMPINASVSNLYHIDIHKAQSPNPTDGLLSNTVNAIGGNGDDGVAVMHLDYQDILSARLRNPLLINSQSISTIEFYASAFVTTGHWWEISITPANEVTTGEYTSIPGQGVFGLPGALGGSAQPGPGHDNPQDSINLVSIGETDVPCATGWWTRFGATKRHNGVTTHYVNTVSSLSDLTLTDPADSDVLKHWKVQMSPNNISLFKDENDDQQFELVETWAVGIPWSEVYVHFLAVAYQADHHPQEPCYLGHIRELKWRNIKVSPVKYAHTDVYPKNDGIIQIGKNEGWLSYDTRDIQRFGLPVNNAPQPNTENFTNNNIGLYCNDTGFPCFGSITPVSLPFTAPSVSSGLVLDKALVLADLKNGYATPEIPVTVSIGPTMIGAFQPAEDSPVVLEQAWIRRSIEIPAAQIPFASNPELNLTLGMNSYLDRIEIEFYYSLIDLIFKDDFE